ncbi:MBL fold metallo-hydrolase [Roseovarius dicentrarchi]|uniref:MBL fold metallo-hydrolase n=1 Tax=Roseovarius dicentrarchi TaxID=2250573 RepID=UPI000DEB4344|nr:MBL fold metallo-hydrolase [Roseovarius dicentrarchi]
MPQHTPDIAPTPGLPVTLAPGLRCILAPNPSSMTLHGTNTYLVGSKGLAVIDPGPADPAHLAAIRAAVGPDQHISHILVTHAHLDHSPLARPLATLTGAPVLAYGDATAGRSALMQELAATSRQDIGGGEGVDAGFAPDICLADEEIVQGDNWSIAALWTPGHFGNHMCFAIGDAILTGDLVMGWATSLISPPDGDMSDYMASCRRLSARRPHTLYPGHGAPVTQAVARIEQILAHRLTRETAIIQALKRGPADARTLAAILYQDTPATLLPAATRSVLAHLIDLTQQNRIFPQSALRMDAVFESHEI